jgi:SAM-dependent methyltransferase
MPAQAIVHYHRGRLALPGVQPLGWRTLQSQESRFAALCGWGKLDGLSLLDLGCGRGDLKAYLDRRYTGFSYLGVDILPEFVAQAQFLYGAKPNTHFMADDFMEASLPKVDVALASGSLNYACDDPDRPYAVIERMWERSRKGVAFNMLDARYHPSEGLLLSQEPQRILDFCRTFDARAELVTGYHPEDFTVLMRRRT